MALQNSNIAAVREAIFDMFMLVHYGGMRLREEKRANFRSQLYDFSSLEILRKISEQILVLNSWKNTDELE